MRPTPFVLTKDLAAFVAKPGDRVWMARCCCVWRCSNGVHGSISWGKVTDQDVDDMCAAFDAVLHSPLARHPSVIDIRALESISVTAFDRFLRTLTERSGRWRPRAGRQAVVHASSFPGALALGALRIGASDFEVATFEDTPEAFAWLGASKVEPRVAALRASLLDVPDVVRRVRVALDAADRPLSAADLSRALGLSSRTLQRHLAAAGTSIRAERTAHLLRRAERLLLGTELDLGAIAAMLGMSSAARLVALFRAERNTTPGAWRRAAR